MTVPFPIFRASLSSHLPSIFSQGHDTYPLYTHARTHAHTHIAATIATPPHVRSLAMAAYAQTLRAYITTPPPTPAVVVTATAPTFPLKSLFPSKLRAPWSGSNRWSFQFQGAPCSWVFGLLRVPQYWNLRTKYAPWCLASALAGTTLHWNRLCYGFRALIWMESTYEGASWTIGQLGTLI